MQKARGENGTHCDKARGDWKLQYTCQVHSWYEIQTLKEVFLKGLKELNIFLSSENGHQERILWAMMSELDLR